MFQIGNVKIKNKVVVAPLSGISNSAFRRILKEMGASLIYAEMVSSKGITFKSEKTMDMLYMTEEERPISQQIFGSDVESFIQAAKYIYKRMKPDIIDINMGCPVPKVALKSQAGSALLKDLNKIFDVVSNVVKSVPIPVTVKIRSGWDSNNINAVQVAKVCERAGASAIAIHGRTRSQGYSGKVNLDIIKEVKESVSIPVIGNGDIKSYLDAKRMFEYTKCDAIMIGRGILGNPWLIKECVDYLNYNKEPTFVSLNEKLNMIKKHLKYLLELKNERIVLLEMRSHIAWYLKGLPKSSLIKQKINTVESIEEMLSIIENYFKELQNET